MRAAPLVLTVFLCATTVSAQAQPSLKALAPEIETHLQKAILDFWFPRSLDREFGGYLVGFDAAGQPAGAGAKMIVTQARMLWVAARLVRAGRGGEEMREAARQGYRFLMERMWDTQHGGFYWEVDRRGAVTQPHKHLYGQAFGLFALSEYARATGDAGALADARRLFALLEEKAHDPRHGGYIEFFAPDWSPPPAGVRPYLGPEAGLKLMNTHLHLMEALSTFVRAGGDDRARLRLVELIAIQSHAVIRREMGAGTDQHRADWTPLLDGDRGRASYGHDLENIWLIVDALDALGLPSQPLMNLFRQLFANALEHGYDRTAGGFYDSGPLGRPADRRDKVWWVQAEALVSALTMYRLTGEAIYARVLADTWRFVNDRQTDWSSGEWHPTIAADGTARGAKGSSWKAAYHNARALLECLERIDGLTIAK